MVGVEVECGDSGLAVAVAWPGSDVGVEFGLLAVAAGAEGTEFEGLAVGAWLGQAVSTGGGWGGGSSNKARVGRGYKEGVRGLA